MSWEKAREKYLPGNIKYLFIDEAPPPDDSGRYFYYEYVTEKDDLFLNLMKALYPVTYKSYLPVREIRKSKKTFLDMFMNNGCYLIDAVDDTLPADSSRGQRIAEIKANNESLLAKIKEVCNDETKVILLASTVYAGCYDFLKSNGVNVANEKGESIYFPDRWNKEAFHEQMKKLLLRVDWQNAAGKLKSSVKIIKKQ